MDSYVEGISLRAHLHHQLQLQMHQRCHPAQGRRALADLHADVAAGACHESALAFVLAPPAQTAVEFSYFFIYYC